jgi:ankyrin repeat protein
LKYWIHLDSLGALQTHRLEHTPDASLLYICAEKNLPELIKVEVERVSNIDIRGERHQFPMFAACTNGNKEAIKALFMLDDLAQKSPTITAHIESMCELRPQHDWTPLHVAAERGEAGIVRLLLRTGKITINRKDVNGVTPMLLAVKGGHADVVKLLLDTGQIDVNAKDKTGTTLLSWAALRGHAAVVKLLLDTGQVDLKIKDRFGTTLLSWVVMKEYGAIVQSLLETGQVDVNARDNHGRTPLSRAECQGNEAIVELLKSHGAVR